MDKNIAIERYGILVGEALQNRLADLRAATSLNDLIVGEPAVIFDSTFKVNLSSGYRLVFFANNRRVTYNSEEDIDWLYVSRIKILRIEPYDQ